MVTYVRRLDSADTCDVTLAGGKGAGLAELIRAGFPVPAGFVVTTNAYTDFLGANALASSELAGSHADQLRDRISTGPVPGAIADAIRDAYRELGSGPVAVRSSGTAEDLADASFAGQHDTYLDVTGEESVLTAVRDCWASLWTPRAVAYRAQNGWDERGLALAVVVQTMVDAEWAGVTFTANPVSGRRDRLVIEAVRGLGEALVSGEATGHHLEVDKGTGQLVDSAESPPSPLPPGLLDELVKLGTRVEEAFGRPQDIEWAYAEERCALVQARPLTALPDAPDAGGESEGPPRRQSRGPQPAADQRDRKGRWGSRRRRRGPDYQIAADHVPYPPFPMDLGLSLRPAVGAILDGLRSAGFTTPDVDDVLVEIDDGVVQVVPPRIRPTARALIRTPAALPKLIAALRVRPTDWLARCHATLVPLVERIEAEDLTALSDRELLDRVRELRQVQGELVLTRFSSIVPWVLPADRVLATVLRLAVGRGRSEQLHTDLLSGIPSVTRAASQELDRLAATIHRSPDLSRTYAETPAEDVPERLRETEPGRALLDEIDAYLRRFGFRQIAQPLAGFPPLRETPAAVHGMLKGHAPAMADRRPTVATAQDDAARAGRARADLAGGKVRTRVFGPLALKLTDAVRTGTSVREDSHFHLFMVACAAIRRVLLDLGRRYVERGLLTDARDIFYLELDEVTTPQDVQVGAAVARRKAAREAALATYTVVPAELLGSPTPAAGAIHGTPASRGTVVGPVRIIRDETDFGRLAPGDVLVCRYTNPAWTPLFSLASAVVTDAGGAASHAAIVAREYGIPAVMGTGDATRVLTDGQLVRVDGDNGTVVRVDAQTSTG
ncbi:PEP/pyruvate-binding domain-containing protein [Actinopolymorpha sp. B9G3]|uniref:PEP/pyruvate-binding domain-containing protein n=1 Tax=Actinopolymorpha sp. B9G3 TaxID=3158970 RepID=UPI0032D96A3D